MGGEAAYVEQGDTIARRIVAALREDIVALRLAPGDALSESDVAARYGISRQPAREAFIRLAEQGLLLIRPKRATIVKKISVSGVRQSRFVREAIEVEIVRRVAAARNEGTAPALAAIIAEQKDASAAGDAARFHGLDDFFHRTLSRLAGAEYAWRLIDEHKIQLDRVRYITLGISSQQRAIAEHERIAEAVATGDPAASEAAMRAHLAHAEVLLQQTIAAHPDFFEPAETETDGAG